VLADLVALSPITNGTRVTHRVDPPIGSKNLMLPAIPEVVLVHEPEPLAVFGQDVADLRGGRVLVRHVLEVFGHQHRVAVKLLTDPEVVQVGVRPAHRRLDVFV
jgi:hypothetical protein